MRIDPSYRLPQEVTGVLRSAQAQKRGALGDLLLHFRGLNDTQRKRSVIMLDRKIPAPVEFDQSLPRERMNLFDGEANLLLPYLDEK
jgi:hypothetical protein